MLRLRSFVPAALVLALVLPVTGCSDSGPQERSAPTAVTVDATIPGAPHVIAISVDGLSVEAITRLGAAGAPTLHRLLDEGAGTLNARTERELTITLPNHTSMVTGRRIAAAADGHGVTWNDDRSGTTVQRAAGNPVSSVFSAVGAGGGTSALYSTKAKFSLFERSWPSGLDTFRVKENQRRLVRLVVADLSDGPSAFTFLHVSLPDRFGHEYGGMSEQYLDAVRRTDDQLGTVLDAVTGTDAVVILTADHGFATGNTEHSVRTDPENFRIPFVVWGAGVDAGDLYEMNPSFRDPGTRRTSYAGKQPVRNGNVANLALDLLGLDAVEGSGIGEEQQLTVSHERAAD